MAPLALYSAFGRRGPFGTLALFVGLGVLALLAPVAWAGGHTVPAHLEEAEASSNSSIFDYRISIPDPCPDPDPASRSGI